MSKLLTGVFIIGLMLVGQVSVSHAAGDIFILIPGIQGEVPQPPHTGWSQVDSVAWAHGEAPPGSPIKIQFGRVNITKRFDSTSAALALLGATGQPIKDVKLEIMRTTGGTLAVVFRMKLTNVRVASYAAAIQDTLTFRTDQIGFSFDTITWITFKLGEQGQSAAGSSACWDVVKNTTCPVGF